MTIHIYSLERKPLHCKRAVISMKAINHEGTDLLVNAILSLKNTQECTAFLQDLLTISELQSMAQRIYVAKLLKEGHSCVDVTAITGASSATVSRVNRCLHYGENGYTCVLERLEQQKP